ncbi:MAG TPA: DUF4410 domain-containing protein [Candidatus Acidoferrum sp.]|jgi:hypothetical protein|nr:DUF4410 domain-containing protein [Candidatus Acidoferrum sp.]
MKRFGLPVLVLLSLESIAVGGACLARAQQSSPSQPGQQAQAGQNQIAPQPPPPPPPQEEGIATAAIETPDIPNDSRVDRSKIIYVTDFEIDAVDGQGKLEKGVPAVSVTNPSPSREQLREEDQAAEQAGRLVDFMSITLMKELKRAGFSAHRLRPEDSRPTDGIRISGIFAEPDAQNRLRRAVMGTFSPDGKMSLFVGIANLERPDQAIYGAAEPGGASRAGSVITVSSYAPVARFEIGKVTTEKAVRDTAAGIVADLNALLSANVIASR